MMLYYWTVCLLLWCYKMASLGSRVEVRGMQFPCDCSQLVVFVSAAPRWLDSQKSTETRQITLAEYCHSLINLPPHISRCKHLASFFKVRPEDENPPAPNTSVPHTSASVTTGVFYSRDRQVITSNKQKEPLHVAMYCKTIISSSDWKETRRLWRPESWPEATHPVRV